MVTGEQAPPDDVGDEMCVAGRSGDKDDPSVAGGTGAVGAMDGVSSAGAASAAARRHARGFAVLRVFPLFEFYLLHVYVLLQLALYGR